MGRRRLAVKTFKVVQFFCMQLYRAVFITGTRNYKAFHATRKFLVVTSKTECFLPDHNERKKIFFWYRRSIDFYEPKRKIYHGKRVPHSYLMDACKVLKSFQISWIFSIRNFNWATLIFTIDTDTHSNYT